SRTGRRLRRRRPRFRPVSPSVLLSCVFLRQSWGVAAMPRRDDANEMVAPALKKTVASRISVMTASHQCMPSCRAGMHRCRHVRCNGGRGPTCCREPTMEDLSAISAFVRVVEARSFAAAAPQLGISASGVSRAVSRLEAALGVRLLARSTRSLNLTEEGRAFYERCRRILADLAEATETIGDARDHPQGRLRVAASMSLGRALVLPH